MDDLQSILPLTSCVMGGASAAGWSGVVGLMMMMMMMMNAQQIPPLCSDATCTDVFLMRLDEGGGGKCVFQSAVVLYGLEGGGQMCCEGGRWSCGGSHKVRVHIMTWRRRCRERWSDREKERSHSVQRKGLIPVCLRKCRVSSSERAKRQVQPSQVQW